MLLNVLSVLAGLALLLAGGDGLVRGSVALATRMGVSPLFVGLVLVGFGTSAPELFASVEAVRIGAPAIAWGNVAGSNVANVLLILGATATVRAFPVERGALWRDGGVGAAAALLLLAAAFGGVTRMAGMLLFASLLAYLAYAWRTERMGPKADTPLPEVKVVPSPLWRDLLFTFGGLAFIVLGGNLLIGGARALALALGMSETLVGLSIVAIGTSAPELATSIAAVRKGHGALAFGNVLGSNIYNILAIGGVTAILAPGSLPPGMLRAELPIMVLTAGLLMVFARTGHRFSRTEGAVMLALYLAYLGFAIWRA